MKLEELEEMLYLEFVQEFAKFLQDATATDIRSIIENLQTVLEAKEKEEAQK